ncbi:DUF2637 domain-containing protein [Streptomyces sp. SID5475]|nr:DUF2637 domain-containing protein [Streptomyces sp. SID5475]
MTITEVPQKAAADIPASHPPGPASSAPEKVSGPPRSVSRAPKRKTIKPGRDGLMTALSFAAAVGGTLVGIIGFAMSYSTLAKVALSWGFSSELAPWFPVGVDASIIAFLALDLYLIRKDTPWPVLRLAAHAMTAATIWFNASSQGQITDDPVQAASHGVMPFLFVIGVEAARRLFIKKTQLEAGTATDRIPLHRWILSPIATPRFYRRMRLHGIASYPEMIRRQQELTGYEQWLKRKYHGDLSKASDDEKLPMKMAAHGYTVSEALALPEQQEREAEKRKEEAERRRLDAETRRKVAQKKAEAEELEADGELEAVRARVDGQKAEARARARAQAGAAERAAELEEQAMETALVAEARAREAEALRKEAQEREAQAAADVRAAELERQAAEKRKAAAEADRVAAAEDQAVETATMAEARRRAAEADQAAAETEKAAAEARRHAAEAERRAAEEAERQAAADARTQEARQREAEAEKAAAEKRLAAAEIERRAVEIEDAAKLTPRERAVRRVARMILTAGGEPDQVLLADIQRELAVSSTDTASKYRQEAAELLREGYQP